MSPTQEAMFEQMAYLNFKEHEPYSSASFLDFVVNGRRYTPSKGTVRNYLQIFRIQGKIKYYDSKSNPVRYELIESKLLRKMTHDPMGSLTFLETTPSITCS